MKNKNSKFINRNLFDFGNLNDIRNVKENNNLENLKNELISKEKIKFLEKDFTKYISEDKIISIVEDKFKKHKKEMLINLINDVLYEEILGIYKNIYNDIKGFKFKDDFEKYLFFVGLLNKIENSINYQYYFFKVVDFFVENYGKSKYDNIIYQIENTFGNFGRFVITNQQVKDIFMGVFNNFLLFYSKTIARNIMIGIFYEIFIVEKRYDFFSSLFFMILSKSKKIKSLFYFPCDKIKSRGKIFNLNNEEVSNVDSVYGLNLFLTILNELSLRIFIKGKSLFSNSFRLFGYKNLENGLKEAGLYFKEEILNFKNDITNNLEKNYSFVSGDEYKFIEDDNNYQSQIEKGNKNNNKSLTFDNNNNNTLYTKKNNENILVNTLKNQGLKENIENLNNIKENKIKDRSLIKLLKLFKEINDKINEYFEHLDGLPIDNKMLFVTNQILSIKVKNRIEFFKKISENKFNIINYLGDNINYELKNILFLIEDLLKIGKVK